MKKLFIIAYSLLVASLASAQNMREIWLSMPDSLVPYLNNSLRTEVADYVDMKDMKPEVNNLLDDTTRINRLTNDYMLVRLTNSSVLEMRKLNDNRIATVWTWFGPAPESTLRMFDSEWNELPVSSTFEPTIVRPDSMTVERFEELKSLLEPRLIELRLSPEDNSVTASYSLSLLSREEKKAVESILRQRKYSLD